MGVRFNLGAERSRTPRMVKANAKGLRRHSSAVRARGGTDASVPYETMRSPMNKENRHTTRTVVAKRGSVVLAPVPTAREPRRPRSQQTDAVLQLVTAVKDHLRFRQLATYAVDTFSKSLAPPNADWRAYARPLWTWMRPMW